MRTRRSGCSASAAGPAASKRRLSDVPAAVRMPSVRGEKVSCGDRAPPATMPFADVCSHSAQTNVFKYLAATVMLGLS